LSCMHNAALAPRQRAVPERRIPRGRSRLDSSPSVTSSPVAASDWAGRQLADLGDRPSQSLHVRDADGVSETKGRSKSCSKTWCGVPGRLRRGETVRLCLPRLDGTCETRCERLDRARVAHNPEVGGSNPPPATTQVRSFVNEMSTADELPRPGTARPLPAPDGSNPPTHRSAAGSTCARHCVRTVFAWEGSPGLPRGRGRRRAPAGEPRSGRFVPPMLTGAVWSPRCSACSSV